MAEGRLKTELWVKAHLRQCSAQAIPAVVARRGEADAGAVVVKINRLELGCLVLTQARDVAGRPCWLAALDGALVPEAQADAYIARSVTRDPDLWVIEIEDREGRNPFEGRTL
ncbi:MAG: DUF1491 family protein [Alphaproteobacteria bacterium]